MYHTSLGRLISRLAAESSGYESRRQRTLTVVRAQRRSELVMFRPALYPAWETWADWHCYVDVTEHILIPCVTRNEKRREMTAKKGLALVYDWFMATFSPLAWDRRVVERAHPHQPVAERPGSRCAVSGVGVAASSQLFRSKLQAPLLLFSCAVCLRWAAVSKTRWSLILLRVFALETRLFSPTHCVRRVIELCLGPYKPPFCSECAKPILIIRWALTF